MPIEPITWSETEIRDVLALIDLSLEFGAALDRRDWDRVAAFFTGDAIIEIPAGAAPVIGGSGFAAQWQATWDALDASQSLHANQQFSVVGDRATGTFYAHVTCVREAAPGGRLFTFGGAYRDEYRRGPAGWLVTRREFRQIWGRGNPGLLAGHLHSDEALPLSAS